jgi:hypothetical protein
VFRLFRLLLWLAVLCGFVWFGSTVPLGSKTLFEHLRAIGRTEEAHDLVEGAKEAARPIVHKVENTLTPDAGVRSVGHPGSVEQLKEDRKYQHRSVERFQHPHDPAR